MKLYGPPWRYLASLLLKALGKSTKDTQVKPERSNQALKFPGWHDPLVIWGHWWDVLPSSSAMRTGNYLVHPAGELWDLRSAIIRKTVYGLLNCQYY